MRAAIVLLKGWVLIALTPTLCAALAVGGGVAGCAERARGFLPGASDAWTQVPTSAAPSSRSTGADSPVWNLYPVAKTWPALNEAPFTSIGHLPSQAVDVRADPSSRALYLALVQDSIFPDGSVLFESSHSEDGPAYAMQKRAGVWLFYGLDTSGVVSPSGTTPLCHGCHDQAPADGVFGLPRSNRPLNLPLEPRRSS